ncbi:MAG: hypothetical protein WA175_09040 [Candidatus Acidiferrales bacterium]
MNHSTRAILTASLLLLLATATAAQMGMGMRPPMPRGMFNPVVGAGAVYEMVGENGEKMTMQIAVVGKESVNGKDAYWFETIMTGTPQGEMVMKSLTVLDGTNTYVARMIMQPPGRPPMEMPEQMLRMHGQTPQPADIRSQADDLGIESVTVPAGTFVCHHYRIKQGTGDVWVTDKVSPYGLVKQQGNGSTMVLLKVISDARDKITGTPEPFNPAAMGMGQPPDESAPPQY